MYMTFNFNSNGFIMTSPKNDAYFGEIDYTIPFYAVDEIIKMEENYLVVRFKKVLSNKVLYNQKIVKLNHLNDATIYFDSQFERDIFIENVKKYNDYYN